MPKLAATLAVLVLTCGTAPAQVPADSEPADGSALSNAEGPDELASGGPLAEELNLGFEAGAHPWFLRGGEIDNGVFRFGARSLRLAHDGSAGFAVATGSLPIDKVGGKHIQYSGWIKTREVESGYAGLWLRVDAGETHLFLDNMHDRGRTGTTDWTHVTIDVGVPEHATNINFGALLPGKGTAWIDGLELAITEPTALDEVHVTGTVFGAADGPAAGAVVAIVPEHGAEAAAVGVTDENGQFELTVPAGRYAVTATSPGATATHIEPRDLDGKGDLQLHLGDPGNGFRLAGRVIDENGQGVAAARVQCIRYSEQLGDIFYTRTGPDGYYEIALLHAHHACSVEKGKTFALATSVPDETTHQDFTVFAAGPAPSQVVDWIRENAVSLLTVRAERGFDDMQPLKALVGDARIVGLGEATHGTREFFQMKHRMLEFLVSEMGFTVFAIEANWPESEAVNEYVLTGKGDPAKALAGMYFWTWDTEEVLELIEWMRRWNADPSHESKVKFYGFDMQFSPVAAARLFEYLDDVDPELASQARERLGVLTEKAAPANRKAITDSADAMKESLVFVGRNLEANREVYEQETGERPWLIARQALRILEQNVESIVGPQERPAVRDRSMAENLRWIADKAEPDAKIVAWAHNGHIATLDNEGFARMMGHHLEEALGPAYLPIGFAFHRGSFQAIGHDTGLTEFTVGPAPEGSVGDTFQRADSSLFVLDLRRLPTTGPVAAWFGRPQIQRAIGAVFSSEEAMRAGVVLPEQFEAVIFVEATTRARSTPTGERPPRQAAE